MQGLHHKLSTAAHRGPWWLGHAARKPSDVRGSALQRLQFAHSLHLGHSRPMGRPHLTGMDTAVHDMGGLGQTQQLQFDLLRDWASSVLDQDVWRGVVSWC